jgi:SAM-dependent methyltransferase
MERTCIGGERSVHWEKEYSKNKSLWGEGPSELALAAVAFLKDGNAGDGPLNILDLGCGYGRDVFYYAQSLNCAILGIDVSAKAIEIATGTRAEKNIENTDFQCRDLADLSDDKYGVVCASNLYQLLKIDERIALQDAVKRTLKPGGQFFLCTMSLNDPEHYGKGTPIAGESNSFSFKHRVYLHFCTREELMADFGFLDIIELYEHEFDEPRAEGPPHHHISWILIGRMPHARR